MKAIDIAIYFLTKANQDGDTITNLKLQKLLYYAEAWHLVNFNKPLFEENIEAWNYGPVIPEIYYEFKKFKYMPISVEDRSICLDKNTLNYLDQFYNVFIGHSANALARATHHEDPWKEAYSEGCGVIDKEKMKQFYKKQYKVKK